VFRFSNNFNDYAKSVERLNVEAAMFAEYGVEVEEILKKMRKAVD
jgi:hypothetical protein